MEQIAPQRTAASPECCSFSPTHLAVNFNVQRAKRSMKKASRSKGCMMAIDPARDIGGKAGAGAAHDRKQVLPDALSQRFEK